MAGTLVPVLLLGLLLIAGLVVVVVVGVRAPAPDPSRAAEAARRHAATVHFVALTLLLLTLVAGPTSVASLPLSPVQGVLLGLVPTVAGLVFAAVQALGELTWPRPTGTVRRAPLTRRTPRDVAPAWLRRAAWGWAALTVVTLVACGLTADDGRRITRTHDLGAASAGPFPGWYFGIPLLAAVAVVLLTGEVLLRLVARRPAVSDADPGWDLALRRLSAHRALRGTQLVLAWTAAGVLGIAGNALRNVGTDYDLDGLVSGLAPVHHLGTAAVVLAVVAAIAGPVLALVPGTAVGAQAPASSGSRDRAPA